MTRVFAGFRGAGVPAAGSGLRGLLRSRLLGSGGSQSDFIALLTQTHRLADAVTEVVELSAARTPDRFTSTLAIFGE